MSKFIKYWLYTATEIAFYQKYKIFPDELFIKLQSFGFSREAFKPIQKEMDKIFFAEKSLAEFTPTEFDPFTQDNHSRQPLNYLTIATL